MSVSCYWCFLSWPQDSFPPNDHGVWSQEKGNNHSEITYPSATEVFTIVRSCGIITYSVVPTQQWFIVLPSVIQGLLPNSTPSMQPDSHRMCNQVTAVLAFGVSQWNLFAYDKVVWENSNIIFTHSLTPQSSLAFTDPSMILLFVMFKYIYTCLYMLIQIYSQILPSLQKTLCYYSIKRRYLGEIILWKCRQKLSKPTMNAKIEITKDIAYYKQN